MSNKKGILLEKIYKFVFTILTLVLGILFALFSYVILTKGKQQITTDPNYVIYNIDIVNHYLNALIIPFILWIMIIIGGFIIKHIYKIEDKSNAKSTNIDTYNILSKKIATISDKNLLKPLNKLKLFKTLMFVLFSILSLVAMIFPSRFIFNKDNYQGTDTNSEVIKITLNVLPYLLIVVILFALYIIFYLKTIKKEIVIMKSLLPNINKEIVNKKKTDYSLTIIRIAVLSLSLTLITLGLINDGYNDVLAKAIAICTECIGLA